MQAWDHCHTPEPVFQQCGAGKRGGKKFWLSRKQTDISLQVLQIKAKGDKIQKKKRKLSPEQLAILSKCVHLYSVPCLPRPFISSFSSFSSVAIAKHAAPAAAALQCIAPRRRGMHITHLHTQDDAHNFLSRNHCGSRKSEVSGWVGRREQGGGGVTK